MMSASKHFSRVVLSAAFAAVSLSGFAATQDGDKGNSSTAKADVTATVAQKVQITDADLIDLSSELSGWTGGDVFKEDTLCVWSSTHAYQVTIADTGGHSNPGTGFYLTNATFGELEYSVSWADENPGLDGITNDGDSLTGQVATAKNKNCNDGNNATLRITLASEAIEEARAGDYTGELTVVVAPE